LEWLFSPVSAIRVRLTKRKNRKENSLKHANQNRVNGLSQNRPRFANPGSRRFSRNKARVVKLRMDRRPSRNKARVINHRIGRVKGNRTKEAKLRIGHSKPTNAGLSSAGNLNRKKARDLSLRNAGRSRKARQIRPRIDSLNGNRRKAVPKNADLSPRKLKNAPAKIGKTGRTKGELKRCRRAERKKHRDRN
jgi:hypothetical protein